MRGSNRSVGGVRHTPAAGSANVREGAGFRWVARATLASVYPPQLCTRWARIICDESPIAAFSEHATAVAVRFAAELEGLVHRGKRTLGHSRAAASAAEQQLGGLGDTGDTDSTLKAARKLLRKHRVVFGVSSGARGGREGSEGEGGTDRRASGLPRRTH